MLLDMFGLIWEQSDFLNSGLFFVCHVFGLDACGRGCWQSRGETELGLHMTVPRTKFFAAKRVTAALHGLDAASVLLALMVFPA